MELEFAKIIRVSTQLKSVQYDYIILAGLVRIMGLIVTARAGAEGCEHICLVGLC